MEIRLIRNACVIIQSGNHRILVDPCLGPKGSLPPYAFFRKPPRLNPVVDLPPDSSPVLEQVTCGLVTHCRNGHFDHLDRPGMRLLSRLNIPVYCNRTDDAFLRRRNIQAFPLDLQIRSPFLDGFITSIPTRHGHGLTGFLMGKGVGYFLELPDEKTVYIAGDTVMTPHVRDVLQNLKPEICIINAGTASLDFGKPILMTLDEQMDFIRMAPGKVVAVHLDAFNHGLTTRAMLNERLINEDLHRKTIVPQDGEALVC